MISRENKIKLLELLFSGEITLADFKTVLEMGVPRPITFCNIDDIEKDSNKNDKSIDDIYKKLGFPITQIVFKNVSKQDVQE